MAPFPDPPRTPEGQDSALDSRQKAEDADAGPYHMNARHLLYPNSSVTRFPVPDEKVPWEVSGVRSGGEGLDWAWALGMHR